jgi:uncharacterized protein (DUF2267 family)
VSTVHLESIDRTVQLTHIWINDLDSRLGWESKARSYRLLRTVLQVLRDWLPTNESADFAAQLPELLRGAYYEHWRPATTPVKQRSKDKFLERVDDAFRADPMIDTSDAVSAVFVLLSEKIAQGEVKDVRQSLPADIRALWPSAARAA